LGHPLRVDRIDMAVSVEDQLPAIFVSLPLGDDLHVNPPFDGAGDEHPAQGSVGVMGEAQPFTRRRKCLASRLLRKDHTVTGSCGSSLSAFEEGMKLRVDRNHKARLGLMSKGSDRFTVKVNVRPTQCHRLRLTEASEAQELDEVGAFLRIVAKLLRADVGHYRVEFLP